MALDGVEYYGGVGYLKAGLHAASAITTVSPTYAQEIRRRSSAWASTACSPARAADLVGIVNGIDTDVWNPDDRQAARGELFVANDRKRASQPARGRGALRPGERRRPAALRRQPAHLAEGHGHPDCRLVDSIVAAGARLAVLGSGDHGAGGRAARAARPAIPAASASSSATTRRCRI